MSILKLLAVIIPFIFTSCKSGSKSFNCNENMKFKSEFSQNITLVRNYTLERKSGAEHTIKTTDFLDALNFISKYTKVSMDKVSNYEIGYPTYETFETDEKEWKKWYESNKCNNIQ
jgi:hypothetical protein